MGSDHRPQLYEIVATISAKNNNEFGRWAQMDSNHRPRLYETVIAVSAIILKSLVVGVEGIGPSAPTL